MGKEGTGALGRCPHRLGWGWGWGRPRPAVAREGLVVCGAPNGAFCMHQTVRFTCTKRCVLNEPNGAFYSRVRAHEHKRTRK